jgi:hypothetical protein
VRRAGYDAKSINEIMGYLRRVDDEVKPQFDPSWDGSEILAAVSTYVTGEMWLVKRFFKRLAAEIEKERGAANGFALDPDGVIQVGGPRMAMLSVHYRKEVRFGDDVPVPSSMRPRISGSIAASGVTGLRMRQLAFSAMPMSCRSKGRGSLARALQAAPAAASPLATRRSLRPSGCKTSLSSGSIRCPAASPSLPTSPSKNCWHLGYVPAS